MDKSKANAQDRTILAVLDIRKLPHSLAASIIPTTRMFFKGGVDSRRETVTHAVYFTRRDQVMQDGRTTCRREADTGAGTDKRLFYLRLCTLSFSCAGADTCGPDLGREDGHDSSTAGSVPSFSQLGGGGELRAGVAIVDSIGNLGLGACAGHTQTIDRGQRHDVLPKWFKDSYAAQFPAVLRKSAKEHIESVSTQGDSPPFLVESTIP